MKKTACIAIAVWIGLFIFCLITIGPGLAGGWVMAQDVNMNVHRLKLNNGKQGMVSFQVPPGAKWEKEYQETDEHGNTLRIIRPYTDLMGNKHKVVISTNASANPSDWDIALDPQESK